MTIIWNTEPQGSDAWKAVRRGAITGSRAKDARDRSDGLTEQQRTYVNAIRGGASDAGAMAAAGYKKAPTADAVSLALAGRLEPQWGSKALGYAMDLARQRLGGVVLDLYASPEMRIGTAEEAAGRMFYEDRTGHLVELAGFAHTADSKFGCSVDGLVNDDGIFENKVMVSSATLFKAVIDGDTSEYRDQCLFEIWLLRRQWCDLTLYVYDMPELSQVIRIARDEDEIQRLEDDMVAFERLVSQYEAKLRALLGGQPSTPPWEGERTTQPATPAPKTAALPASIFD